MSIAINEWAAADQTIQMQLNELQPLCQASGCIGLGRLSLVQDPASIHQRLGALFPVESGNDWLKEYMEQIIGYLDCSDQGPVIFFVNFEEADAVLIYPGTSDTDMNVNNDNWLVISLEPLLLLSMYGAVLGLYETPQGPNIVALEEGDPGW